METMASVLLQRETVEGEAVNALLDGTWDEYLAKHPEKAEEPADARGQDEAAVEAAEKGPTPPSKTPQRGTPMTINEKNYAYGASKSSIREIAAYGAARKAQIGAENVFDFSLGNPSIPAPDAVRESIERSLQLPPTQLHSYTPAAGLPFVREKLAASLCRRYGENTATPATSTSPAVRRRRSPSASTRWSTPVTRSS
jgi:hypothetical protein